MAELPDHPHWLALSSQPRCSRFSTSTPPAGVPDHDAPDCSNWNVTATWQVPTNMVSGLYLAKLSGEAGVNQIPFVVRESSGTRADVLFQFDDATWQAYNDYDDIATKSSFYNGVPVVSYNRPFRNRFGDGPRSHYLFELDLPLIRFLERNGVSLGYIGSADLEVSASALSGRKVYVATGHDEYWPGKRRSSVDAAAATGTHMLFLGEQHSYWKVRYASDLMGNPQRVMVCFKNETVSAGGYNGLDDPLKNTSEWTGLWRDTRTGQGWTTPRAKPENALTGVLAGAGTGSIEAGRSPNLTVPAAMTKLRAWRNTSCGAGAQPCILGFGNAGFEMDVRADRYYEGHIGTQPPGLFSISATVAGTGLLPSPGAACPPSNLPASSTLELGIKAFEDKADCSLPALTIEATMHRKASNALVFASAAFRWPWALESIRDRGTDVQPGAVSPAVQQNLINMLADMNVQPGSRVTDTCTGGDVRATSGCLIAATASTDQTRPVSQITSMNTSSGLITGAASDVGGVVAGVEVSFDAGTTWHGAVLAKAASSTTWSYMSVVPSNVNPRVRAVDDSGNIEIAHGPSPAIPSSDGLGVWAFAIPGQPGALSTLPSVTGATGWTSVVPINLNGDALTDLLFYNRATGATVYTRGVAPGAPGYPQEVVWSGQSGVGWTSIVPMNINDDPHPDFLSYNAATGVGVFSVAQSADAWMQGIISTPTGAGAYRVISDTRVPAPLLPPDPAPTNNQRVGWTTIVPIDMNGDTLTDLLSYNATTGLAVYSIGVPPGSPDYPQRVVAIVNAAPGWTSIVPMKTTSNEGLTDLLSYNAATGAAIYSVGVRPGHSGYPQRVEQVTTEEAGWTTIVPMNMNGDAWTDLFWFNAATGRGRSTVARPFSPPEQNQVQNAEGAKWWTSIVPMNLNTDTLTDLFFVR